MSPPRARCLIYIPSSNPHSLPAGQGQLPPILQMRGLGGETSVRARHLVKEGGG